LGDGSTVREATDGTTDEDDCRIAATAASTTAADSWCRYVNEHLKPITKIP
jgi:hypothetical protein